MELDRIGFSTVEIRDFLNMNGIRPPRTDMYSTKLVWMTVRKLKDREVRKQILKREISDVIVGISHIPVNGLVL